jgi:hypothetical protein
MYVLPVEAGVPTLLSKYSDGLEELRLLDVPNRFNVTLISPSFNYAPWYGDNPLDAARRMESFVVHDLVPFGDSFAQGTNPPRRYLIGFSKSGNGALCLMLRHPDTFSAAAAWDAPAQVSSLSALDGLQINFGTQENLDSYNIPSLVSAVGESFREQNRIWISGDQSAWTDDMSQLHEQMVAASIEHTWVSGGEREHSWRGGWLDAAVTNLDANDPLSPPDPTDTVPPVRTGGEPSGVLATGTTATIVSLTTDESATCRYATTPGVTYGSMTSLSGSAGGTAHSTTVSGLVDGGSYSYYVRCQDATGNSNADDYAISFSVAASGGGATGDASSTFVGVEDPLSENGMWQRPGSWGSLKKSNGAYATTANAGARLALPVVSGDQAAEITYDQDPGSGSWVGVLTRVQGPGNGSGYLAIAYAGQVRLYRADDVQGQLRFTWLAGANAGVSVAPRHLRLESEGTTHRVYFNGVQMLSHTDTSYATGQPGIAAAVFGGPTVRVLAFSANSVDTTGGGD